MNISYCAFLAPSVHRFALQQSANARELMAPGLWPRLHNRSVRYHFNGCLSWEAGSETRKDRHSAVSRTSVPDGGRRCRSLMTDFLADMRRLSGRQKPQVSRRSAACGRLVVSSSAREARVVGAWKHDRKAVRVSGWTDHHR